jgi:hypothetical protein
VNNMLAPSGLKDYRLPTLGNHIINRGLFTEVEDDRNDRID